MATIPTKKMLKAILLIFLIICLPLFLALYEQLFLSYYQESIADLWASYFVIPLMGITIIYLSIGNYKTYHSTESKNLKKTLKNALLEAFIVFIFFFYIFSPIISGTIIIINANIGHQNEEIVEGLIIGKRDYNGRSSHEYRLTIKTDTEVLIFQTDTKVIVNHHKGEFLKETMKRGSLGLLYKW